MQTSSLASLSPFLAVSGPKSKAKPKQRNALNNHNDNRKTCINKGEDRRGGKKRKNRPLRFAGPCPSHRGQLDAHFSMESYHGRSKREEQLKEQKDKVNSLLWFQKFNLHG